MFFPFQRGGGAGALFFLSHLVLFALPVSKLFNAVATALQLALQAGPVVLAQMLSVRGVAVQVARRGSSHRAKFGFVFFFDFSKTSKKPQYFAPHTSGENPRLFRCT